MVAFAKLRGLNGREMKALFILSIVAPVGLLAAFRLTGVLREPATVKRITLETATLTLVRPTETTEKMIQSVQNQWTQGNTSVTVGVEILAYGEGFASPPYNGRDSLNFRTYVNATSKSGYFSSILLSFHPLDSNSLVFLDTNPWSLEALNASIVGVRYYGTSETEAYAKINAFNSSCRINDQIYWIFLDENDQSHDLQITVQVAYTGETSDQIISIPINLEIAVPNAGERPSWRDFCLCF